MAYSFGTGDRTEKAKAAAGVVVVHIALGALILSGLDVRTVGEAVERLKTFDISEAPPPRTEPVPPPQPDESSAPEDEAAPANIRSRPTPVVAPTPPIPLPIDQRVRTAEVAGPEGANRTAGAADDPGAGTGAGGQGTGFGGGGAGGTGSGAGRQAQLLGGHRARLGSRFLRSVRVSEGSVPLQLTISRSGRVTACRPLRSSGSDELDAELCRIMRSRSRWAPAADRSGRPIEVELTYVATFSG